MRTALGDQEIADEVGAGAVVVEAVHALVLDARHDVLGHPRGTLAQQEVVVVGGVRHLHADDSLDDATAVVG